MTNATVLELFATISEIDAACSSERALDIFQRVLQRYGLHSFAIARLPVPYDREWQREILAMAGRRNGSLATSPKSTFCTILVSPQSPALARAIPMGRTAGRSWLPPREAGHGRGGRVRHERRYLRPNSCPIGWARRGHDGE